MNHFSVDLLSFILYEIAKIKECWSFRLHCGQPCIQTEHIWSAIHLNHMNCSFKVSKSIEQLTPLNENMQHLHLRLHINHQIINEFIV